MLVMERRRRWRCVVWSLLVAFLGVVVVPVVAVPVSAGVVEGSFGCAADVASVAPTGGTSTPVAYDAAGRLGTVTSGASTVQTRTYQPDGRLRSVTAGSSTNLLDWDPAGGDTAELLAIQTAANTVSMLSGPWGIAGIKSGATVSAVGQDWFGSVKSGVLAVSTSGYDAWGAPTTTVLSWVPKLGYRGEVTTGSLTHLRAREYHASSGVFTSVDPVEQQPGTTVTANPYGFVLNQPTMLVDPSGMTAEDDCSTHPDSLRQDVANGFGGFLDGMTFGHADDVLGVFDAEGKWCGRTGTARVAKVGGKITGAVVAAVAAAPAAGVVAAAFPVTSMVVGAGGVIVGGYMVGTTIGECVEGVVDSKTDQAWEACGDLAAAGAGVTAGGWATRGGNTSVAPNSADDVLPGLPSSAPPPAGLGSTGRVAPANLTEQLAMTEVKAAPAGRQLGVTMTDARWPGSDGWEKMAQHVNGVEVHYVRNRVTGAVDDFKFVGGG